MLYTILSPYIRFPWLGYILNSIYYGMIVSGVLVGAVLFYKRLSASGYPAGQLKPFFILSAALVLPLGIIGSRAANIFYYPASKWSISFFWDQFLHGPHQTFHACIVLPLAAILILAAVYRMHVFHVFDTLMLYLPLGHAFGRGGCLLVGCCYGNTMTVQFFGRVFSLDNPVPLYAIILNLCLFFMLRNIYNNIYISKHEPVGRGKVAAWYLMGYSVIRFLFETVRKEKVVGMGMTQAQWVMLLFFTAGLGIRIIIEFRRYLSSGNQSGKNHSSAAG